MLINIITDPSARTKFIGRKVKIVKDLEQNAGKMQSGRVGLTGTVVKCQMNRHFCILFDDPKAISSKDPCFAYGVEVEFTDDPDDNY